MPRHDPAREEALVEEIRGAIRFDDASPCISHSPRGCSLLSGCVCHKLARAILPLAWNAAIEEAARVASEFRHPNPYPTVYDAIARDVRTLTRPSPSEGEEKPTDREDARS